MIINGEYRCDFCYTPHFEWKAKMEAVNGNPNAGITEWHFDICDSCRLLLRNVIGPVLHRITHTELVAALVKLMVKRGLSYEDLMTPLRELTDLATPKVLKLPDLLAIDAVSDCTCIEDKTVSNYCGLHGDPTMPGGDCK